MGAPPVHISGTAKGAAHHGASTPCRVGVEVGEERHRMAKEGSRYLRTNEVTRAPAIRMDKDGHTGGQQFWARGGHRQGLAVCQRKGQSDQFAAARQIIDSGQRERGLTLRAPGGERGAANLGSPFTQLPLHQTFVGVLLALSKW